MIDRNFILNLAHKSGDMNEYMMSLYNIPVQRKDKTIVEIGSGVSTFALLAAAQKNGGNLTSIDIGGIDTLNRCDNGAELIKNEPNFTFIAGNSLEIPIIKKIDFLFLDSGHTFDLTTNEINRWFPHVKKGGIIMMHDTGHEAGVQMQCRYALNQFLKKHSKYIAIHLLDTKILGMTILYKL